MIRHLIGKLLQSIGCSVTIEGDILTASRGGARLTIGFPSQENVEGVLDQIANVGGHGVLIPLFEGTLDETGVPVLNRDEVEYDVTQVLLKNKETSDTILGSLVDDFLGNAEIIQEAMVKPTLDREEVVEIGSKTVDGFNYILELVPYFVFDYTSTIEEDGEIHESKGTIGINALTKSPEIWELGLEVLDGIEYFDRKQEPKTDEKEAFEIAQKKAIEMGTVVRESVEEREDTTIEKKKSIKPKKEDVQIEGVGLVYMPIWCVEGSKGSIIVNASTGKILKEDLYS